MLWVRSIWFRVSYALLFIVWGIYMIADRRGHHGFSLVLGVVILLVGIAAAVDVARSLHKGSSRSG